MKALKESLEYTQFSKGSAINSPKVICSARRPCHRLVKCSDCTFRRREYFISACYGHAKACGLLDERPNHLTLSFLDPGEAFSWIRLDDARRALLKPFNGKLGSFIKCWAIEPLTDLPHLHLIVGSTRTELILELVRQFGPTGTNLHVQRVTSLEGLLGYLFDMNFIPTYCDKRRPRGYRLLTASRGFPCGFPPIHYKEQIRK